MLGLAVSARGDVVGQHREVVHPEQCFHAASAVRYRGHDESKTHVLISGTRRGLTVKEIIDLRSRSAIEADIGHMKTDGRLSRCPLKGTTRDALRGPQCLRRQYPKDTGSPPGLACLHYRSAIDRQYHPKPPLSDRRCSAKTLRVNDLG
jgi:hypothetical protein